MWAPVVEIKVEDLVVVIVVALDVVVLGTVTINFQKTTNQCLEKMNRSIFTENCRPSISSINIFYLSILNLSPYTFFVLNKNQERWDNIKQVVHMNGECNETNEQKTVREVMSRREFLSDNNHRLSCAWTCQLRRNILELHQLYNLHQILRKLWTIFSSTAPLALYNVKLAQSPMLELPSVSFVKERYLKWIYNYSIGKLTHDLPPSELQDLSEFLVLSFFHTVQGIWLNWSILSKETSHLDGTKKGSEWTERQVITNPLSVFFIPYDKINLFFV